jgi:WD40 repeat protein
MSYRRFLHHMSSVFSVAISSDGTLIASAAPLDDQVRIWDWNSGTTLQVINTEGYIPVSVAFSPDNSRLLVGSAVNDPIFVYRLNSIRPAPPVEVSRRYVNAKVVLLGAFQHRSAIAAFQIPHLDRLVSRA